jgi:hypothetical protein
MKLGPIGASAECPQLLAARPELFSKNAELRDALFSEGWQAIQVTVAEHRTHLPNQVKPHEI